MSVPMRLFVALYPPPEIARALLDSLGGLGLPEHRATPVEQVHMTLHFLGDTEERELDDVLESVERSAAGLRAFELRPERLITLPKAEEGRRRVPPRLVAAQTDAPAALMEVQRRLAHRLARRARRDAGDRFLPHITLCRFREGSRLRALDEPLAGEAGRAFPVAAVALMRSVLSREGARHEEVWSFPLGG